MCVRSFLGTSKLIGHNSNLITIPRSQYRHHFPDAETDKLRNIQLVRGGAKVLAQVSVKLQGFPLLLYSFVFSIRSSM